MLHINRVTLLGFAGRDPDLRALPDGGRCASFSLATTEKWKDYVASAIMLRPGAGRRICARSAVSPQHNLSPAGRVA